MPRRESLNPPDTTRRAAGLCPTCGYPMAQLRGLTCPECGSMWSESRADHEASMRLPAQARLQFAIAGGGFLAAGLVIAYFAGVIPPRWISWLLPISPARGAFAFWAGLAMLGLCWTFGAIYLWPVITGRRTGVSEDVDELMKRD